MPSSSHVDAILLAFRCTTCYIMLHFYIPLLISTPNSSRKLFGLEDTCSPSKRMPQMWHRLNFCITGALLTKLTKRSWNEWIATPQPTPQLPGILNLLATCVCSESVVLYKLIMLLLNTDQVAVNNNIRDSELKRSKPARSSLVLLVSLHDFNIHIQKKTFRR